MLYAFDVDGTLVRGFLRDDGTVAPYEQVEVLPGRLGRIEELTLNPGARFALVTNQAGVAFGYQTVEQVYAKLGAVVAAFDLFRTRPFSVHVAFHHPKAKIAKWWCAEGSEMFERRKPGPGMLLEAMGRHKADTETTWFVGDMGSDEVAAWHAGVRYIDAEEFFHG